MWCGTGVWCAAVKSPQMWLGKWPALGPAAASASGWAMPAAACCLTMLHPQAAAATCPAWAQGGAVMTQHAGELALTQAALNRPAFDYHLCLQVLAAAYQLSYHLLHFSFTLGALLPSVAPAAAAVAVGVALHTLLPHVSSPRHHRYTPPAADGTFAGLPAARAARDLPGRSRRVCVEALAGCPAEQPGGGRHAGRLAGVHAHSLDEYAASLPGRPASWDLALPGAPGACITPHCCCCRALTSPEQPLSLSLHSRRHLPSCRRCATRRRAPRRRQTGCGGSCAATLRTSC